MERQVRVVANGDYPRRRDRARRLSLLIWRYIGIWVGICVLDQMKVCFYFINSERLLTNHAQCSRRSVGCKESKDGGSK